MNLYKCQLEKFTYYVTALTNDGAAEYVQKGLNKGDYGFSSYRNVISVETKRLNVILTPKLDHHKCKLFLVEGEVLVYDVPDDKFVIGRQYVIANNFDDAHVASNFSNVTNIKIIAENETFIDKYKFEDDYLGIILKPV